jgi:RNA polymerase primary sigma factor
MELTLREDGVQDYLKRVGSHRILNREEEVELFQRIEAGDESARDEVVRCNLRLVVKIAMQFKGYGLPLADLIQEGNVGLLHVTSKFDWRRGFRFSTYAAFWIRQEIQAALRNNGSLIRLPIRKARLMGRISEAIRHFNNFEGRDPHTTEIADYLNIEVDKIEAMMPLRESITSLDMERNEDGGSLLDLVAQDTPAPSSRITEEQTNGAVRGVLRYLSEREREILELRFGLNDGRSLSLRKTSKRVGLSQEGVRRIERRALDKLQRPSIISQLDSLMTA